MARTTNEFGGGEIVPAIEAITGIQAPVMADFQIVPNSTVTREDGSDRRIQNQLNNLKASSGIERIPFNGIDELDTESGSSPTSLSVIFGGSGFVNTSTTSVVNITNTNGASGAATLTFTPAAATAAAFATAWAAAWNADSNARLSEYTARAEGPRVTILADAITVSTNLTANTVVNTISAITAAVLPGDAIINAPTYAINTGDSRIRFVGKGWQTSTSGTTGTVIKTVNLQEYVEITFFGTALNLLVFQDNTTGYDWRATVDGGVESGNLRPATPSDVLKGNIKTNVILPVTSGLSAGPHTVIVRNAANPGTGTDGLTLYGCEIINENAGITQQPGADFDGRVEALGGTTFPIKPDNSTVPSADRAGNAATYTNSNGLSGVQGARVLNYLTSGGQYKQVFNTADAAISAGPGNSSERTASIYTLQVDGPGSGTATTTSIITIPQESTTLSLETFGAGGDGGNGTVSGGANLSASGGGGGGGAYANASYTKTAAIGDTLTIVAGAGSETGNVNNTTVTGGGALSGNFTVNSGMMGGTGDAAAGTPGAAGTAGTIPTSATITGLTITGTPTFGAGNNGTIGEAKSGIGDGNVEGGNGGLPGNQPGAGQTDNGGSGFNTVMPGEIPGGGGGGGGATFTSDFVGAQGGLGRVTIIIRARAGLSESQFGSNVSIIGTPVTDGTIFAPSSDLLGTPENIFASASHGNQEVIRRINYAEFGANNEFATLGDTGAEKAFTLDDGTTTLTAGSIVHEATINSTNYMSIGADSGGQSANHFILTFVGTGLDVFYIVGGANATRSDVRVFVDGFRIGDFDGGDDFFGIRPIVSGLAYGTHTVRFQALTESQNDQGVSDFIIYGPKKPEIPTLDAGSLELSDYNIMADYDRLSVSRSGGVSKGVVTKSPGREFLYTPQGWGYANDTSLPFGARAVITSATAESRYTFYGTGIEFFASSDATGLPTKGIGLILPGSSTEVRLDRTNFSITYQKIIDITAVTSTSITVSFGTNSTANVNAFIATDVITFDDASASTATVSSVNTGTGVITIDALPSGITATNNVVQIAQQGSSSTPVTVGQVEGSYFGRTTNSSFSVANGANPRIQVSGLPLGATRARLFNTGNEVLRILGANIITPIHINDDTLKVGSEGLNNLTIDPIVEEDEAVVQANLGEAKAWLSYNTTAGNGGTANTVLSSFNIAAVIQINTAVIQVYFDKPFKDSRYVVSGIGENPIATAQAIVVDRRTPTTNIIPKTAGSVQLVSGANDTVFNAVFHGELIDE